jgi:hypothetical protein
VTLLQTTNTSETGPDVNPDPPSPPRRSRLVPRLCWIASATAIAFALVWIAVAEDKGPGIFSGLVAVAIARILLGDVARWHEEEDAERRKADRP